MGVIKQMMIEQGYFDDVEEIEAPYYSMNNRELMEDGKIVSEMWFSGMSNEEAKELLESFNNKKYTDDQWEEVLYHADYYYADTIHNNERVPATGN